MAVPSASGELGFAILAQDLSYIERREARARTFLIVIFAILAITAFGVPLIVARRARHDWSSELRSLLHGGGTKSRDFQPNLSDVRELIGCIPTEQEDAPGQWTATRLKVTLNQLLHGEKIVILANRESYIHQRSAEGQIEIQHPASGLVTALEPVMRACSGVWVAHGSGDADRETVDRSDHISVPPGEESYRIRRVWLSDEPSLQTVSVNREHMCLFLLWKRGEQDCRRCKESRGGTLFIDNWRCREVEWARSHALSERQRRRQAVLQS